MPQCYPLAELDLSPHLSDPKTKLLISTSLPGLHPGSGQGQGAFRGEKHDTRQIDLVGKLRHKRAIVDRVTREGFLEEVFALPWKKRREMEPSTLG